MEIIDQEKKNQLKKELERMMAIDAYTRSVVLKAHADYILKKEGRQGLEKVEKAMAELGWPVNLKKIDIFSWKRDGLLVGVALVAKTIFNWPDEEVFLMGKEAARSSFLVRLTLRYLISPKIAFKNAYRLWERYYKFGKLETVELNEKEKYAILRVIRPKVHPIVCNYYKGYITQIGEYILGKGKVQVIETKCQFKGDPYHEYLIKWL